MSSMSKSQQSIAGGIFQTITKLCITVGFGISTAIYNAVEKAPATSGYYAHDPIQPYASTFWFSTAVAACSVVLVPFLTIGTQGHSQSVDEREALSGEEHGRKMEEKGTNDLG